MKANMARVYSVAGFEVLQKQEVKAALTKAGGDVDAACASLFAIVSRFLGHTDRRGVNKGVVCGVRTCYG